MVDGKQSVAAHRVCVRHYFESAYLGDVEMLTDLYDPEIEVGPLRKESDGTGLFTFRLTYEIDVTDESYYKVQQNLCVLCRGRLDHDAPSWDEWLQLSCRPHDAHDYGEGG